MKTTETVTNFLEENANYKKVNYIELVKNVDISKDDEVWLFQCPKHFDISTIEGSKIKLPGKTNLNSLELIVEESSSSTSVSFAALQDSDKLNLRSIKVSGGMILRKQIENRESDIDNNSKFRVQFPTDIKTRHPLNGICYEEKIKKSVKDRLRKVDKILNRKSKKENFKDNIKESSEIFKEESKKKSKTSMDISKNVENIHNIKIEYDANEISLNWLKNI